MAKGHKAVPRGASGSGGASSSKTNARAAVATSPTTTTAQQQTAAAAQATQTQTAPQTQAAKAATQQTADAAFLAKIPKGWNNATSTQHDDRLYYTDAKKSYIQQQLNVSEATAAAMENGISSYSGSQYTDIRLAATNQFAKKYPTVSQDYVDTLNKKVAAIEDYISKSPKFNGTTYRGINVSKTSLQSYIKSANAGKTIDMKGMSSWSSSEGTAQAFSNGSKGNKVVFVCSKGQPRGTSITALSGYNESEVLCSKSAKWKMTGYKGANNGIHYFEVEAV